MEKSYAYRKPLLVICALFFLFGFITWINGILVPYFQICLELSNFQASLVLFASYSAYFFMALPCAYVLKKTGYKKGLVTGLLIMASGTLLFIPAAYQRTYALFLLGLFVTGTGLTLLQAAANPYVAVIGPMESTAQRVGFLGLSNKIAGIICVTVLGSLFLLNADDLVSQVENTTAAHKATLLDAYALKIVVPYLLITGALVLMALFIRYTHLPEIAETKQSNDLIFSRAEKPKSVLASPHLVLGVCTLFLASACEMIPVDSIILYGRSIGMPMQAAQQLPNYGLGAMLLGYTASILFIPRFIEQHHALQIAAIWGLCLAAVGWAAGGMLSVYCLAGMGFGTALFWGTIWGLALRGLGRHTKTGGAMLLMSVIGGATLPLVFGHLIDRNPQTPQQAILLLLPLYAGILAYSTWGYRLTSWQIR